MILPFHIVSDNNGFTAEYGTAGYETAKEFFKNRVIDQHTFSVFMKSSVNALSGMSHIIWNMVMSWFHLILY